MLDAMVGFSRLSPISVAPPWASALAAVERRRATRKGLRVAYVSDIAGIGVDAEIDAICRTRRASPARRRRHGRGDRFRCLRRARSLPDLARRLDGRPAVRATSTQLDAVRREPARATSKAGLRSPRSISRRPNRRAHRRCFTAFATLFERFDVLLTPAAPVQAVPGRDELSDRDQRPQARKLCRLDRAGLPGHAGEPAGRQRAGRHDAAIGLPVGLQIVAPRFEEPRILSVAKLVQQINPIGWPAEIEQRAGQNTD